MESPDIETACGEAEAVRFKLFVAGESPRSRRAIENLKRIVESSRSWCCEIEVIDVLAFPDRAEEEHILATPTLIRETPLPRRRVTGDLSDHQKVIHVIGPGGGIERPGPP